VEAGRAQDGQEQADRHAPNYRIEALKRQKARQATARLAAGVAWQDQHHLIFTDALGRPARPDNVSGYFRAAVDTLGLPTCTLPRSQHSAATLMLSQGVPLKVVSEPWVIARSR